MIFVGNSDSPLARERFYLISKVKGVTSYFFDRKNLSLLDQNLKPLTLQTKGSYTKYHLSSPFYFWKAIKQIRPNIIHFHGVSILLLAFSLIGYKGKVISTPQGSDINQGYRGIYSIFTRFLLKRSDVITVKSRYMLNRVKFLSGKWSEVINWGVDEIFEETKYVVSDSSVVKIFSPRSFKEIYNVKIIIDAIEKLKSEGFEIHFTVATLHDHEYLHSKKHVIDQLKIKADKLEMCEILSDTDFMISIPSYDGFSTTLIEALFLGVKPIISDIKPYSKEFSESYLVTKTKIDVSELYVVLKKEIESISIARKYKSQRVRYAISNYSRKSQIEKLKSLYFDAL
ncbi:hypothetical protein GCM10007894_08440 [Paraferrimonas haliotis]|uniref:Glycosyltransferase subfamily 4-like N-terminal domain-containing protein n=1 Tax=Paraferrimonas haliotis TaxID=2013866 RepID=A0AA37TK03_9GAMM|nr:hypothetical protein GCM10007894_08440 [Paraferrimonas haliotis]